VISPDRAVFIIGVLVMSRSSVITFDITCLFSGIKLHCIFVPRQAILKPTACSSSEKQVPQPYALEIFCASLAL
jgi:hypothetical protein